MVEDAAGGSSIRIADFGLACCDEALQGSKQGDSDPDCGGEKNSEGTFPYMAFEVLLDVDRHTYAADVWGLGVIYGELMAQASFIRGNNKYQVLRSICKVKNT